MASTDWAHVTFLELFASLAEVDWKVAGPDGQFMRTIPEFIGYEPPKPFGFSRFQTPAKLAQRLKCNVYFYRANYGLVLLFLLLISLYRRPISLVGVVGVVVSVMLLNDSFANSFSDRFIRLVRRVHAPTATRMRNSQSASSHGQSLGRTHGGGGLKVCGLPRMVAFAVMLLLSIALLYVSGSLVRAVVLLLVGVAVCTVHGCFRTHNLKARITSAREEFRAVWRSGGYSAVDYTL